ncbi:MAG TPA: RidA family protein [Acidobacteriota bacterium]|jgi:2-iminobutanoate/2-iminopropanoate deaminase
MSQSLERIATKEAPAAMGPYSQAIRAGGFVFCAGQVGLDPSSGKIVEGVEAQAERALRNLEAVLREAGGDLSRVVKTTVFLADMADFQALNSVYARLFGDHRPARSTVAAAGLPGGARVEVEAIAYLP